ncbi:MAG: hypothetical protein GXY38_06570 [Planctomycetes bacterium]|nr:hypothetical protein [Planctomycetota bacterium]
MNQARIKQTLTVKPGLVYEMMYSYRSEDRIDLHADVASVGTGPQYRINYNPPSKDWVRRRLLFLIPQDVHDKGQVVVLLQNRSTAPIWYRDVSLRETNLAESDILAYQPSLQVKSLTADDAMIMPDSDAEFASFVGIGLPDGWEERFTMEARIYTSDGRRYPCDMENGRIRIPIKILPPGESELNVMLYDRDQKEGRLLVAYSRHDIVRISQAEIPDNIDFSRHEVFRHKDGTAFFPVGMYAGLGWNFSVGELHKAGFNTVHTCGTDSWKVREENFKLLSDARKHGMWVMMGLPPRFQADPKFLPDLAKWIDSYKDSPAILFYYTDETHCQKRVPPAVIRRMYEQVKKSDPDRRIYSYERPDAKIKDCMDGVMWGVTSRGTSKLIKVRLGQDKPMIHVFGQGDHHGRTSPSLEAFQYEYIVPVIYGARGVFYWNLRAIQYSNPEGHLIKQRLYRTVNRFSQVAQDLLSEDPNPQWTHSITTSGDAEMLVKTSGRRVLILGGVNRSGKGGEIRIQPPVGATVRDVLNAADVNVKDGCIIRFFRPGQAVLLEVSSS